MYYKRITFHRYIHKRTPRKLFHKNRCTPELNLYIYNKHNIVFGRFYLFTVFESHYFPNIPIAIAF